MAWFDGWFRIWWLDLVLWLIWVGLFGSVWWFGLMFKGVVQGRFPIYPLEKVVQIPKPGFIPYGESRSGH